MVPHVYAPSTYLYLSHCDAEALASTARRPRPMSDLTSTQPVASQPGSAVPRLEPCVWFAEGQPRLHVLVALVALVRSTAVVARCRSRDCNLTLRKQSVIVDESLAEVFVQLLRLFKLLLVG